MASLNLSSLMESFALATGIPASVWRTVSNHTTATAQPEAPMKKAIVKVRIRILGLRECMAPQKQNHDE